METVTPTNYLTHPRFSHRITLPKDRQHRSPKMRQICQDLLRNPGSTRRQVMGRVNPHLSGDSNRCYFRRIHDDQTHNAYGHVHHDEATYSVIINGLVQITGKTLTGRLTYELTDAGRAFAQET